MLLLSIGHGCTLDSEIPSPLKGPFCSFGLHDELFGGGVEEATTVLDLLVCRRAVASSWRHRLAWGWSQREEPWPLVALHK